MTNPITKPQIVVNCVQRLYAELNRKLAPTNSATEMPTAPTTLSSVVPMFDGPT